MGKEIEISAILAQRIITLLLACPLLGNLTSSDWLLIFVPPNRHSGMRAAD
jgi:hypothetical protein